MLRFFYGPGACSLAPHILLVDSGCEFDATCVDVFSSKPWPPEYIQFNPKKQVPFIEVKPGVVVTENGAVLTYVNQLATPKKYFGTTNLDVARTYEWISYLSTSLHAQGFGLYFRPDRFTNDRSANSGIKDRARKRIAGCYEYIEGRIANLETIERVLAVDAHLFVFYRWGKLIGFDMKAEFPKFHARMAQFAQLKSVQQTLADEGIDALIEATSPEKL